MNQHNENESGRIEKILAGQMICFSDLIQDYQQYVYLTAIKIVKNTMDAEEITQDVFIKVYRNLSRYRGESKFTTWLYKIVYHTCLDFLKRKQLTFENSLISHDETIKNINDDVEPSSDISEHIKLIIDTFPEKQKMVMTLFYLQQFSYIEIADIMDETISNIKTLLFRGRNELKNQIESKRNEHAV